MEKARSSQTFICADAPFATSNAFHEKAGQSQGGFVLTSLDSLPLGCAASVAILPSAVFSERLSLAANGRRCNPKAAINQLISASD
jgi:hypothetical protein